MSRSKFVKKMKESFIPDEVITNQIFVIRGQRVMIDRDLAKLYGVETKRLIESVKRNSERFPADFMFELNETEMDSLRSQFATLKRGEHSKYFPKVFTEQGVAMLSAILHSRQAIKVNIQIIRIFTKLRHIMSDNTELRIEIEKIKNKLNNHSQNIELVFKYLDELIEKKSAPVKRKKIDYKIR